MSWVQLHFENGLILILTLIIAVTSGYEAQEAKYCLFEAYIYCVSDAIQSREVFAVFCTRDGD